MKLYGHPGSTCTRRALAVLHAKEAQFEFVLVDTMRGQQKRPEHLARQPFGQVPAWEDDDGFMLYECRAICRHVDRTLPGATLTPTDARGRALMDQWMSVEASYFSPPALQVIAETLYKRFRGGQPDQAVVDANKPRVAQCVAVLEEQLRKTPFIAGDQLTIADLMYMPCIDYLYAGQQGDVIDRSEAVSAWWQKLSAMPLWARTTGQAS